ncbi:MAG: winged helix-turn-helix transcriptional regulator, partial [Candidatus Hodarchaeota archaeon]
MRFVDFIKELKIPPKTLTSRLRDLERFNLITRTTFDEIPPRVEYSLTEPGRDLEDVFARISLWVKDWSGA